MRFRLSCVVALSLLRCASTPSPAAGTERGACYPNGTCNDGLTCASMLCVAIPSASDAGTTAANDAGADAGPSVDHCGFLAQPYACQPFDAGSLVPYDTSCDAAAIGLFVPDCFGPAATAETCGRWFDGNPVTLDGGVVPTSCVSCLSRWSGPDGIRACLRQMVGREDAGTVTSCRDAVTCADACFATACRADVCNDLVKDGNGTTELDRCVSSQDSVQTCASAMSGGASAVTLSDACLSDPEFQTRAASCVRIDTLQKYEFFFRGACRNGGDFSAATTHVN
jgi:hypothetical protein